MRLFLALSIATLPSLAFGATTPQAAACAARAYTRYAEAMSQWEPQQEQQIMAANPSLTAAANLAARVRGLEWSRDSFRVKYLALNEPARLRLDNGLSGMADYQWTRTDEFRLRASEPEYPAISERAGELRTQYNRHTQRAALENYVEKSLLLSPAYLQRLHGLRGPLEAAGRQFDQCKPLLSQTPLEQKPRKPVSRIE